MKILVIGYMHPKEDKRVFRTVRALSKKHQVIYQYWTDNDEKGYQEGTIKYIPIKYVENVEDSSLKKLSNRKPFDKQLCKLIANEDYDILYMHHFLASRPLEPFKIAKNKNKKIIYDIHEYHPENFLAELSGIIGGLKTNVVWHLFKKQLKLSDLSIFVSEETRDDIIAKTGIKKEKTFIMPNYASFALRPDIIDKRKELVLVGKTTRKIEDEKKLLNNLIKKGFSFKVIGMDSNEFDDIPHTSTSFLPYKKMMEELSKASFSLISYNTVKDRNCKNYIFALPNKYYDSLAAGTPIVVKESFVSMAKQVKDYGVGVAINPTNLEESVEKILKAYENYENILKNIEKYQNQFVWSQEKEQEFLKIMEL